MLQPPVPAPGDDVIVVEGTLPSVLEVKVSEPYVRARVTYALVWIFGLTILATFATFWFAAGKDWRDIKDLVELVITPEVAILASAIGFYFGNVRR